MKPRCQGARTPGHFTSFDCVLDDGHDGFCEPYAAPTVDEHRVMLSMLAELDALRAILASGCDACAHATPKHPVSQEATLAEMRGLLDDAGRDLDAETVAGVQAARDAVKTPQPPPVAIGQPVTPALVMWLVARGRDVGRVVPVVEARDAFGRQKYGQPLYSHDGRDVSADFGQELADALQYGMAARMRGVPLGAWAPMLLALADLISGDSAARDDLRGLAGKGAG